MLGDGSDKQAKPAVPAAEQAVDVAATGDDQLEDIIAHEREDDESGDLLSEDAPKE